MRRHLDLADIQGNVLRGFGMGWGWHQFVSLGDAAAGRRWLRFLGEVVSSAEPSDPKPNIGVNVAVSAAGLDALGLPRPLLAAFAPEFRGGMAARAEVLGDREGSAPPMWRRGFWSGDARRPPALALVSAYARYDELLPPLVARLRDYSERAGLEEVHTLPVRRLADDKEHFGFADGFAQPAVAGAVTAEPALTRASREKALPAGEFLLGHRDGEYAVAPGPPGPLGRNGTYMVYRELAQDVAGFQRYLDAQSRRCGLDPAAIAAKMIGRWPNGLPLTVQADPPDPTVRLDRHDLRLNDFGYRGDPEGKACPIGAHIRRVNPRDALGFGDRLSRRHRMIRRGMSYGPPYDPNDPGIARQERGLAFVCFVASIRRQFEFVQAEWCNDGNAFSLGTGRDPVVGHGVKAYGHEPAAMAVPGSPPQFLSPLPEVVRTRGGEYLLLPSISGLHALASGAF